MIKQISSHDLNNIMQNAQEKLGSAQKELMLMKNIVTNHLDILEEEKLWTQKCLEDLKHITPTSYVSVPLYDKSEGEYSSYYFDVLPFFVKSPLNVFNITSTQTVFFRDDVQLSLITNDGQKEDVTDILKHDSLKSTYFFRRFKTKDVTFLLEIKDYQHPLGASRFNVLEIDGFLPGSFKLKSLALHYGDDDIVYSDFNKLGKNRIMLDEKKQIQQIEFAFEILHSVSSDQETYYPFGLKHIYLYDADFKSNSYAIVKIESEKQIDLIQDECMISTNRGVEETTLKALGVEIYAHYADNQLYMPIAISNAYEIYQIPLQLKALYAKVPIKKAMTQIGFQIKNK